MGSWRLRVAVLLTGLGVAVLSASSLAQTTSSERAAYMAGLRLDRAMLAGPLASSPRSAMRLTGPSEYYAGQETRELNLMRNGGVVLAMPRVGPDGSFQRPRVLVGRQSPELHAWMKEAGVTPERCMLPMFRGRMKRDPDTGKLGLAVLMSARCTFY